MPSDTTINALAITYGEFTLDFHKLPQSSLVAMLRRGVAHYLGSEQASKVISHFKAALGEGATKDDVKQAMKADPEGVARVLAACKAKAHDALLAGTVGVSFRGPTVDPITVIIHRLAKAEIAKQLRESGIKPPMKKGETFKTPDGAEHDMDALVARRLNKDLPAGVDKRGLFGPAGMAHIDRLTKEAKRIADSQAKDAKKAKEAAEAGLEL